MIRLWRWVGNRSPKWWLRFHIAMMYMWALALVPTLLWWKESILWVASMSLYANFVGHMSAYQAVRAEISEP